LMRSLRRSAALKQAGGVARALVRGNPEAAGGVSPSALSSSAKEGNRSPRVCWRGRSSGRGSDPRPVGRRAETS
jgi:hypothetical protein